MFGLAWKNMWQRKLRTGLTLLGVAVGLILVIMLTTILDFTEQSMDNELAKYAGAGQIFVTSQTLSGSVPEFPPINSTLREDTATQIIEALEGQVDLSGTTPVVFRELAGPPFPNAPPKALAVGVDPDKIRAYLGDDFELEAGVLKFSSPQAREVILGDLAEWAFHGPNEVGSSVSVAGESLLVVGRIRGKSDFDRLASNPVLMPLKTAQEIFQQPASISALLITAPRLEAVTPLANGIRGAPPPLMC